MGIRRLHLSRQHSPLPHGRGVLAAIAALGVLFAILGGALLPHDHAPEETGHRCVFCQIASVSGDLYASFVVAGIAPPPLTGERVMLVEPSAPTPPAPPAGRLRDPPRV